MALNVRKNDGRNGMYSTLLVRMTLLCGLKSSRKNYLYQNYNQYKINEGKKISYILVKIMFANTYHYGQGCHKNTK